MRATASQGVGVSGAPPLPSGARGPLIHVATRCESLDDFIEKFAGLASEGALVLPASGELPIGTEGRFAIRLKDQSVAMRGRCRVTDARPAPPAPAGVAARPTLLRVALLDMEESSASVHRRLLARRRATAAVPVPVLPEPSDPTEVSPPRSEAPAPGRPAPPPVSALAATMIGVAPPPRARAATSPLGVARAPVLAEPRAPGTPFTLPPNPLSARAGETRVPGAPFTLPANPLSEMNATQLASFIDSTLFESDDEDATLERVAKPPTDLEQTVQRPPPDPAVDPERTVQSPPREPTVEFAAERVEPTERTAYASSPGAAGTPVTGARDPRRIALRALPYVLCVVAGVAIGHALRRAPVVVVAPPPEAATPAPAPVAEAAKPEPAPAPVVSKAVAPAAPAEAKPAPLPAAATAPTEAPAPPVRERHAPAAHAARASDEAGGCQVNVVTEPPDAKIAWRGKPLGATPLAEAAIPCGEGTLTITHERYETVTKTLTAETGVPVAIDERLHRPPATLVVSSSPPGAAISLNGHPIGTAPRRVPTLRYEHLTIKASLPGYAPWTKKIYLTAETLQVSATLAGGGHKR